MKLRYIANVRLPTEKAHGLQIMSMCAAFAAVGAEVELLIPDRFNKIAGDPFEYYGVPRVFSISRLKTIDFTRYENILGSAAYWLQTWSFAQAALKDARKNPAAVYYHRDEYAFKRFAEAGEPSVWELHIVPNHLPRYRRALAAAKKIVVITRGIAEDLIAAGVPAEKILVAPDGADLAKFQNLPDHSAARAALGLPPEKIIALYTGQLFPWKGVDALVEAAAGLPREILVVIVGGGAGRLQELKARAEAAGASVLFVGQVKHDQIPLYLAAADFAVIPNSGKEEISHRYTSPLKLFEALAAGRPIIASDLPSLREVLDSTTAIFTPPDNPAALGQAIIALAADPARRAALSAAARAQSHQYDWTARARNIIEAIK